MQIIQKKVSIRWKITLNLNVAKENYPHKNVARLVYTMLEKIFIIRIMEFLSIILVSWNSF